MYLILNISKTKHDNPLILFSLQNSDYFGKAKITKITFCSLWPRCLQDTNFSNKLDKTKSRAKFRSNRGLKIYGRPTLIKSLLMAQFVYIYTSMLRPGSKIVKDITTFIFNFLWGIKCDKIKRNIVTRTRGLGGLDS